MKFLIISGNPKEEGLCASVTAKIERGARDGGANVEVMRLGRLEACRACNGGWGVCRNEHRCMYERDSFGILQDKVREADALCLVTPVYWGEVSESMKVFLDRLRRCEFGRGGALSSKQVLLVASAGGSGNGLTSTISQLERFCDHVGASVFDRLAINRWNRGYKEPATYLAAKAIADGVVNG